MTIRDNVGVTNPPAEDRRDRPRRRLTITEQFARSMSLADAHEPGHPALLRDERRRRCPAHGFPVRLIAPGWYGVANVKWLTRIEVTDQRYAGRFMARDYVTIREEPRDGEAVWTFTTVSSRPAEVRAGQGDPPRRPLPDHGRGLGRAHREGRGQDRRRAVGGQPSCSSRPGRGGPRPHEFAWTLLDA